MSSEEEESSTNRSRRKNDENDKSPDTKPGPVMTPITPVKSALDENLVKI